MATKSISKTVKICDSEAGKSLLNAIEISCKSPKAAVLLKKPPQRVEKKDIKDFFRKTVK